jgi:hypothetical protein
MPWPRNREKQLGRTIVYLGFLKTPAGSRDHIVAEPFHILRRRKPQFVGQVDRAHEGKAQLLLLNLKPRRTAFLQRMLAVDSGRRARINGAFQRREQLRHRIGIPPVPSSATRDVVVLCRTASSGPSGRVSRRCSLLMKNVVNLFRLCGAWMITVIPMMPDLVYLIGEDDHIRKPP